MGDVRRVIDVEALADEIVRCIPIRCNVLFAEDRETRLLEAVRNADRLPYEVMLARTGEEAVAMCRDLRLRPEAIVMDYDFSDADGGRSPMTGLEAIRGIREAVGANHSRVFVHTEKSGRYNADPQRGSVEVEGVFTEPYGEVLEQLRSAVYEAVRADARGAIVDMLGPVVEVAEARLREYEELVGVLDEMVLLACYRGQVRELRPPNPRVPGDEGSATVEFEQDGRSFTRGFPFRRLEAAGADYPDAQVEYRILAVGSTTLSTLKVVGEPPIEADEPDEELIRQQLMELDR